MPKRDPICDPRPGDVWRKNGIEKAVVALQPRTRITPDEFGDDGSSVKVETTTGAKMWFNFAAFAKWAATAEILHRAEEKTNV